MKGLLVSLSEQPPDVQAAFLARGVSDAVFADCLSEWRWAKDYYEENGKFPTLAAIRARFQGFSLSDAESDEYDTLLKAAVDQDIFAKMDHLIQKLKQGVERGDRMTALASRFRDGAEALLLSTAGADGDVLDYANDTTSFSDYRKRQQRLMIPGAVVDPFPFWPTINHAVRYVMPGEYMVLEARPNFGKTWLTIGLATAWLEQGHRVLFNTIEMPKETIKNRADAAFARLPYQDFRAAEMSPAVMRRWLHWRRNCQKNYNFFLTGVVGRMEQSLAVLQMKIKRLKPTIVIIDGAYKFANMATARNPVQELQAISNRLHQFALCEKVFVVATIQLNRDAEEDGVVKVKGLTSGYGSDAWGQDADIVLAVEGKKEAPFRVINLAKAREAQGVKATIRFDLSPYPNFAEVSEDTELVDDSYAMLDFTKA